MFPLNFPHSGWESMIQTAAQFCVERILYVCVCVHVARAISVTGNNHDTI